MKLAAVIVLLAAVAVGQTNMIVPEMSDNSTPSPFVISKGVLSAYFEYPPYLAFDSNRASSGGTYWYAYHASSIIGGWLKVDMGASAKAVDLYQITCATYGGTAARPTGWVLEGSANDTDWTTIDEQAGYTWSSYTSALFVVASPVEYRYVRWRFTEDVTPDLVTIADFALYEVVQPLPAKAVLGSTVSDGVTVLSGAETGITVLQ